MSQLLETFWLPIIIVLLGGAVTGIWAYVNRRGGQRFQQRTPLPPSWPEMWTRMDAQDKRMKAQDEKIGELEDQVKSMAAISRTRDRAFANILLAASRQWPAEAPGPTFDKRDTDVLGDTMPSDWIKRARTV